MTVRVALLVHLTRHTRRPLRCRFSPGFLPEATPFRFVGPGWQTRPMSSPTTFSSCQLRVELEPYIRIPEDVLAVPFHPADSWRRDCLKGQLAVRGWFARLPTTEGAYLNHTRLAHERNPSRLYTAVRCK